MADNEDKMNPAAMTVTWTRPDPDGGKDIHAENLRIVLGAEDKAVLARYDTDCYQWTLRQSHTEPIAEFLARWTPTTHYSDGSVGTRLQQDADPDPHEDEFTDALWHYRSAALSGQSSPLSMTAEEEETKAAVIALYRQARANLADAQRAILVMLDDHEPSAFDHSVCQCGICEMYATIRPILRAAALAQGDSKKAAKLLTKPPCVSPKTRAQITAAMPILAAIAEHANQMSQDGCARESCCLDNLPLDIDPVALTECMAALKSITE